MREEEREREKETKDRPLAGKCCRRSAEQQGMFCDRASLAIRMK